MNKKIIFLIMMISLIGIVSPAIETIGTAQQGACIDLLQAGVGFTVCNVTSVKFPINRSVALDNTTMQKDGTEYNLTFCSTGTLGDYIVNGFCTNGTEDVAWAYSFEVTPRGINLKTSESILYFLIIFGVFLVFIISSYAMIKLPFSNQRGGENQIISVNKTKYFKLGSILLTYVLFVWLINAFIGLTENFMSVTIYSGFFTIIFHILNAGAYPLFVLIFVLFMFLAWRDLAIKKLLDRGLKVE